MPAAQTLTLTDFLLARIAEDESLANAASAWQIYDKETQEWGWVPAEPAEWFAGDHGYGTGAVERRNAAPHDVGIVVYDEGCPSEPEAAHIARHDPARVLAECEAKRDLVRVCTAELAGRDIEGAMSDGDDGPWLADHVLHTLVLPYADHPDYRQEWRA